MPAAPQVTPTAPTCAPNAAAGVSLTQSASNWGQSAWVTLIASAATDLSVTGFAMVATSQETEYDLGIGGVGAEVVMGTCAAWGNGGAWTWSVAEFGIPIHVPAGSRVSVRTRKGGTTTTAYLIKLLYYPTVAGTNGQVTSGIAVVPAAADSASMTTSGTAWANNTPTQLSASLTDIALIGLTLNGPNGEAHWEVDICTGTAGNEVAVATLSFGNINNSFLHNIIPFGKPVAVRGTNRISFRARRGVAAAVALNVKLVYVPLSSLSASPAIQATTAVHACEPDAAALPTQASNNTGAWAQSNWKELVASTGTAQCLTAVVSDWPGVTLNDEWECDIGVGAAASESVIATFADTEYGTLGGSANTRRFPIPVDAIPASSRVAVRYRKKGTTARTVGFGYEFVKKPLA
jgi:hypothetical protein